MFDPQMLIAWRRRHELTQTELARLLGLPQPEAGGRVTVTRWERGLSEPAPYLPLALEALERRRNRPARRA
jgi:transcriptional regulator with XRE-family HTH domain